MECNPRQNDLRKAQRVRRGGKGTGCIYCGVEHPLVGHHLAGAANDERMVGPVCHNHHQDLHEEMRQRGVDLRREPPRTALEKLLQVLRGLTALFSMLTTALEAWANWLERLIEALDEKLPSWRGLREAW